MGPGNSTPVRGMPLSDGPTQQWRIAPAKDGNALIANRLGETLDIPNGATRDGVRIQTYDVNGEANQRFVFRLLAGPPPPPSSSADEHRWGMTGDGVAVQIDDSSGSHVGDFVAARCAESALRPGGGYDAASASAASQSVDFRLMRISIATLRHAARYTGARKRSDDRSLTGCPLGPAQ